MTMCRLQKNTNYLVIFEFIDSLQGEALREFLSHTTYHLFPISESLKFMTQNFKQNTVVLGDMLKIAPTLPKESFRLIYIDPPFLTGKEQVGTKEGLVYDDRWEGNLKSYLPWLRERLEALFPLICKNGSFVLHLDWRASHYAKVMLDEIYGINSFMNEIIWHYTGGGRSKRRFSCKHDTLLWYAKCGKSGKPVYNLDAVRVPYKETSGFAKGGIVSAAGKKYMPNPLGTPIDDVWDIPIVNPMSNERVGYPTQKPIALLTRLISALSNEGDLVGDFCCGSGTTLVAAKQLNRRYFGCDISKAAVETAKSRL